MLDAGVTAPSNLYRICKVNFHVYLMTDKYEEMEVDKDAATRLLFFAKMKDNSIYISVVSFSSPLPPPPPSDLFFLSLWTFLFSGVSNNEAIVCGTST